MKSVTLTRKFEVAVLADTKEEKNKFWEIIRAVDSDVYKAKNDVINHKYDLFREFLKRYPEASTLSASDQIKLFYKKTQRGKAVKNKEGKIISPSELAELDDSFINIPSITSKVSLYKQLAEKYPNIPTNSIPSIEQIVKKKFSDDLFEVLLGKKTFPTYKRGQGIPFILKRGLFSEDLSTMKIQMGSSKGYYGLVSIPFVFVHRANKRRGVTNDEKFFLEVISSDGVDKIGFNSSANLEIKGTKLYAVMSYTHKTEEVGKKLEGVAGVDLGLSTPAVVSYKSPTGEGKEKVITKKYGSYSQFTAIRVRLQKEKEKLQSSGRILKGGHGRNRKLRYIESSLDREKKFVDNLVHKYSSEVIKDCVKYGIGTVKIEDLSGFNKGGDDSKKFVIRNWSYFKFQSYLEYKAKKYNISVEKVDPRNTSRKCSKCGDTDPQNRKSQSEFECVNCGHKTNADTNASRNILEAQVLVNKKG